MCEAVHCHSGAKEDDTIAIQFLWKGVKSGLAKTLGNGVLHGVEVAIVVVGG
jgi:hypothetical protein